jgi:PadR family transcriptional regulator PadR
MAKTQEKELRRGTLEMLLLKLLSSRAMYGYEIIARLEKLGEGQFNLKEGTVYPVLYRLEIDGFIGSQWETLDRGVPRKYYRLKESGSIELDRLIQEWRSFSAAVGRILETEL